MANSEPALRATVQELLGYLNFSSGAEDERFLSNLNVLFNRLARERPDPTERSAGEPTWRAVSRVMRSGLAELRGKSSAFSEVEQAEAVMALVFDHVLPAYRRFHSDLLAHQTEEVLFGPFFVGRVCEAVLSQGAPWEETERVVQGAVRHLNDFIGHRPVAVLENRQHQPYDHERVRPIPLYVAGAGVAAGPYHDLIEKALEILRRTSPELLWRAWFDPELLDELAMDPRALDFDHPVNRRPNHHFGGWDPDCIDNQGRYRRFVVQQVTLDGLLDRVRRRDDLPHEEVLFEAAAVLICTMLMGSGITGSGPDSHDSFTTLATLLPIIATYRDAFYDELLDRLSGAHAERLRGEADALRQPFGGARQHLNQTLAQRRAEQLQHVHLARLFARLGYVEAAARQANVVPVASARMQCEIDCRLTTAHLEIDRGRLDEAAARLPEIEDLLRRGVQCGALVDPWNILGFQAQFSLFPAVENSVHDHRVDELIELVDETFELYARLEKEAAAAGQTDLQARLSENSGRLAEWWDPFASTEVSSVEGVSGRQAWESASQVAGAITAWHEAGTAAGDIAFWRKHVERFRSPKAFALLTETLIDKHDLVASMALLMVWLGHADRIALAEGAHSFHDLALRWMEELWSGSRPREATEESPAGGGDPSEEPWPMTRKFFDYLEANADVLWEVPRLGLVDEVPRNGQEPEQPIEEDSSEDLFAAAYENVSYRDTTDDGFEGDMLEGGAATTDFELTAEADRIIRHVTFLSTVARLWKLAASAAAGVTEDEGRETLGDWLRKALEYRRRIFDLLDAAHRYRIPSPRGTLDAMVEYDRRRSVKEALLERIIATSVEVADAGRMIMTAVGGLPSSDVLDAWEGPAHRVLRAVLRQDRSSIEAAWPELVDALDRQPLLYVPTSKGGSPRRVADSRNVQRVVSQLLTGLPRLGLLDHTYELIDAIQQMEQNHPAGPGAVTEFDRLFDVGCRGIFECLVISSEGSQACSGRKKAGRKNAGRRWPDRQLVDCLQTATRSLIHRWTV
ncbi:MAG: hypothetical protein ACYTG0_27615, partial [Planctomycetota bacterium]